MFVFLNVVVMQESIFSAIKHIHLPTTAPWALTESRIYTFF